jgi:hypothetical protein
MRVVMKVEQGVNLRIHDQDDVAAPPAVTAVRPTKRLELLAMHGGTTVATVSGGHMKDHPVDKTHTSHEGRVLLPVLSRRPDSQRNWYVLRSS